MFIDEYNYSYTITIDMSHDDVAITIIILATKCLRYDR